MSRTWELTNLEFIVLRDRLVGRHLPWPFAYIGPVRTRIEFLNEKARIWKRLQADWDPDLADLITAAANPDMKVQVVAWDSRKPDNTASEYSLVGYRFASRALLIQGIHDSDPVSCDWYRVVECDASDLSALIVDTLPEHPAGSQDRIELAHYVPTETTDVWSQTRSHLYDDGDGDITKRSHGWQKAAKSTVGMIALRQGRSKFGPQGIRMQHLFWEDHPDDGRYLIDLEPPISAVGIDSDGLRRRIDQRTDEVLRMVADESREGIVRSSVFDD
ncbi:MAG: ESX secretion-associated protein EspG [Mycobacterium sp.]|nr:ESX secretion-associated protein EspG [Mycobacterium sp.]